MEGLNVVRIQVPFIDGNQVVRIRAEDIKGYEAVVGKVPRGARKGESLGHGLQSVENQGTVSSMMKAPLVPG